MREIKFRAWRKERMYGPLPLADLLAVAKEKGFNPEAPNKEIWMQYTGLKDRNGVEIYEGDILLNIHAHYGQSREVFWSGCDAMFSMRSVETPSDEWEMFDRDFLDGCQIIGNIYENPSLLGD